jgi:hypothetical protein
MSMILARPNNIQASEAAEAVSAVALIVAAAQ